MKTCRLCGQEKANEDYYAHPTMKGGRDNKCKECVKAGVRANYRRNREHYIAYEKEREKSIGRKAKKLQYQRERRYKNKVKYLAHNMVNNALRDKRLERKPCEVCGGSFTEAHHDDYMKPLDVRWLCRRHHLEVHGKVSYD
jgi:hypothetical protein